MTMTPLVFVVAKHHFVSSLILFCDEAHPGSVTCKLDYGCQMDGGTVMCVQVVQKRTQLEGKRAVTAFRAGVLVLFPLMLVMFILFQIWRRLLLERWSFFGCFDTLFRLALVVLNLALSPAL
ncbi:hypothetical protein AMECASPLE_038860 [Ameca splendens]|uniref:Uncharacterized protein n=1 Tax=Ameca splendens TaxID=208324 RepID=A0ABV0XLD2_9TELE